MLFLPVGWIQSQWSRIVQWTWIVKILTDQNLTILSIQASHLDAVGACISPVNVPAHPVHWHALWVIQSELYNVFHWASIHIGPADFLEDGKQSECKHYENIVNIFCYVNMKAQSLPWPVCLSSIFSFLTHQSPELRLLWPPSVGWLRHCCLYPERYSWCCPWAEKQRHTALSFSLHKNLHNFKLLQVNIPT